MTSAESELELWLFSVFTAWGAPTCAFLSVACASFAWLFRSTAALPAAVFFFTYILTLILWFLEVNHKPAPGALGRCIAELGLPLQLDRTPAGESLQTAWHGPWTVYRVVAQCCCSAAKRIGIEQTSNKNRSCMHDTVARRPLPSLKNSTTSGVRSGCLQSIANLALVAATSLVVCLAATI